jgi:hypothetical protein
MTTLAFPAYMLPAVQEKAAALTKLANRLGVDAPAVTITREYTARPEFYFLTEYTQERLSRGQMTWEDVPEVAHVEVEISGTTPMLPGGWHLLAAVEHTDAGNFVDCSPAGRDLGLGELLRTAEPTCDHCGKSRQRRWTFVVADENGQQVRVGKGCLAGFLGFAGMPEDALFRFARELREMDDDSWGLSSGARFPLFTEIAALAFCAVREFGWVAGSEMYRITTRDAVNNSLSVRARQEDRLHPTEADAQDARNATEWLLGITDTDNDFLGDLATLARLGTVAGERMGLAVAVVPAYRRHQEQEVKRAERAARPTAPVIIGQNVVITGTVTRTDAKYTDYGVRYVMTVEDDRGFRVWGSIPTGLAVNPGDRITFTATVEPSDDVSFGFVKRPRKAAVLV